MKTHTDTYKTYSNTEKKAGKSLLLKLHEMLELLHNDNTKPEN